MNKKKLYCHLSVPRNFNPEKIERALTRHGIRVGAFDVWNYDEIVKADVVIVLLRARSLTGYHTTGIAGREGKPVLAIQHRDYKRHEFMDKDKIPRCIISHNKTKQIEEAILKFIKTIRPGLPLRA